MRPRLHRQARQIQVEVVRDGAHHRIRLAHQCRRRLMIAHVERRGDETPARMGRQKLRKLAQVEVGEPDFAHFRVLQQIESTRRALEPGAQYEHAHVVVLLASFATAKSYSAPADGRSGDVSCITELVTPGARSAHRSRIAAPHDRTPRTHPRMAGPSARVLDRDRHTALQRAAHCGARHQDARVAPARLLRTALRRARGLRHRAGAGVLPGGHGTARQTRLSPAGRRARTDRPGERLPTRGRHPGSPR